MRTLSLQRAAGAALAVLVLSHAASAATGRPAVPESHRLIVKLTPAAMAAGRETGALGDLLAAYAVKASMPLLPAPAPAEADAARAGFDRVFVLALPESTDMERAAADFTADPRVEYAEIDRTAVAAALLPTDPSFPGQWNLDNKGQNWCKVDADIDAPEAWQLTKGYSSAVIAVIDTGVDREHPELAGKLVAGYDFVNNDNDAMDDLGHGSLVAGIAAAATNNGQGIAGVCWACRVMPLKALDGTGYGTYSWIAAALVWAADHRASIVNMSLGGEEDSITLHDAVRYAYERNIPLVAAMGNGGSPAGTVIPHYPAAYPEVIAVGGTNCDDERAPYSNYGKHIDLVAPGWDIPSLYVRNQYQVASGTSTAAPHVAGVIGLIRSVNAAYSPSQILAILRATADDQVGPPSEDLPGPDQYFGNGRLNAGAAVRLVVGSLSAFTATSLPEDGYLLESAEDSGVAGARDATAATIRAGDDAQNRQYRGILSFDTSGLPDNAKIAFVTLKLKARTTVGSIGMSGGHGRLLVDAKKGFFGSGSGLELRDFDAPALSAAATFNINPVAGWYSAPLGRAAFAQVNPTGRTQLRIRFAADDDNDGVADFLAFYSGNAGAAARPALVVQYYVP